MKHNNTEIRALPAHEAHPVRVVADAAVSVRGLGGGRLIPLVILDTSERPDIEELIRIHQTSPKQGDVRFQWGQLDGHDGTVALFLTFIRPVELTIVLEFDIVKQGILIDQALFGRGLYILAGREGDRLGNDPNRERVLVEIGDTGFGETWDSIFPKHIEKHFRSEGLSRSEARTAARAAIAEMRRMGSFRLRDLP